MNGHMLYDPWAPHPVVNRHICHGGDKGGGAPSVPDYSAYIASMTETGNTLKGYGKELYEWAKGAGINVAEIADMVSGRAGALADQAAGTYKDMMAKWKNTYEPLYDAQVKDARRAAMDLPAAETQAAGKHAAGVAQAFDASREAQERSLRSYGLKAPGGGSQRLDAMVDNQRRLGQVAASEQGRLSARAESRDLTAKTIQQGLVFPQVGQQSGSMALSAGNQQVGAPESAMAATAGAMSPAIGMYNSAFPWMKTWGDTMSNAYNQNLAAYNAGNAAPSSGVGKTIGTIGGTLVGAYFGGPAGASAGGAAGGAAGGFLDEAATGGVIDGQPGPGAPGGDQFVDPSMSESQGAITDDVPARLNVGEFVIPKDVVAWRGENYYQKDIMKARSERESQTVAEPEMGQASAIDMQAPQFQSPGASL